MSKKVRRPKSLTRSVQVLEDFGEWQEIARFWVETDALDFAENYCTPDIRVMEGSTLVADRRGCSRGPLERRVTGSGAIDG